MQIVDKNEASEPIPHSTFDLRNLRDSGMATCSYQTPTLLFYLITHQPTVRDNSSVMLGMMHFILSIFRNQPVEPDVDPERSPQTAAIMEDYRIQEVKNTLSVQNRPQRMNLNSLRSSLENLASRAITVSLSSRFILI